MNRTSHSFWQPQPYIYDYLNLLQATATTFASYGEDKHIVGLALAEQGNASETVAKFFELGAYPYLDEISYHVYATNTGIDDNHYYENHAEQAKEIIAAAGGWKRQTQTENGWPTGEKYGKRF